MNDPTPSPTAARRTSALIDTPPAQRRRGGVTVTSASPAQAVADLAAAHDGVGCGCEDLNHFAPVHGTGMSVAGGLTVATARQLRCLYDVEAAGLATAAVLLGCPDPDLLAAARIEVAAGCHQRGHRTRSCAGRA